MMDFDKKARELAKLTADGDIYPTQSAISAISTALKAAYNEGVGVVGDEAERHAKSLRAARGKQGGLNTVEANTYEGLADSLAEFARAKKAPT